MTKEITKQGRERREYASQICEDLELSDEVEDVTEKIIEGYEDQGLASGRSPKVIAGAATYLAAILRGERRTQGDIAEAADISTPALRQRYKQIDLDEIIDIQA